MLESELHWTWIPYRVSKTERHVLADPVVPLFLTIQHDIAPFGNNKQYTRTLSKGEARATYSVMRRWPDLCPRADHMNMKVCPPF